MKAWNKLISLSAIFVLVACSQQLDNNVSSEYEGIRKAQQWYFETVIVTNFEQLRVQIDNRGRLPQEISLQSSMMDLIDKYNQIEAALDLAYQKVPDIDNDDRIVDVAIDLNAEAEALTLINDWLKKNDIDFHIAAASSASACLYAELRVRQYNHELLTRALQERLHLLEDPLLVYQQDEDFLVQRLYKPLDAVRLNGQYTPLDSLGRFEIDPSLSTKIEWNTSYGQWESLSQLEYLIRP